MAPQPCPLPHPRPSASFWHSEPSSLLTGHRTTRALPPTADVVVIGAGIAGTSAVFHLLDHYRDVGTARDAPSVCLLEAREICWGATGRNGGHCQPLVYDHPNDPEIGRFEVLNHATIASLAGAELPQPSSNPYYPEVAKPRKTFPCEFVLQPSYHVFSSRPEAEAAKASLGTLQKLDPGLASHCRILTDPEEIDETRVGKAHTIIKEQHAARLWPYKFVAGVLEDLLCDTALHGKINVQTWTPVIEIVRDKSQNTWTIGTDRGTITAKHVILATNGYTSHLLPELADLIVPRRGTMSALKPSASFEHGERLTASYGFRDGSGDYLIQRPSEAGGHLMLGGAEKYGSTFGNADDSIVDSRAGQCLQSALSMHFDLEDKTPLEAARVWTGIMGYSRDRHVFAGPLPSPDKEGLFLAAGFTGHGMPRAWLTGKAVALMARGVRESMPLEEAVAVARKHTHLPSAYLITPERLETSRRKLHVAAQYPT